MKILSILLIGVMLGAAGFMFFAPETPQEEPTIRVTSTQHAAYRPIVFADKTGRPKATPKSSPSVIGEWKHEGSILDEMEATAHKYKDVRLQSELLILKDGSFFDRTRIVYDPVWTYFTGKFGLTYVYSGTWAIDADAKRLVLDASRFDVLEVEGKVTKEAAIDEYKDQQKLRTMKIHFLGTRTLLCEDGSFQYDYRRVPSH